MHLGDECAFSLTFLVASGFLCVENVFSQLLSITVQENSFLITSSIVSLDSEVEMVSGSDDFNIRVFKDEELIFDINEDYGGEEGVPTACKAMAIGNNSAGNCLSATSTGL